MIDELEVKCAVGLKCPFCGVFNLYKFPKSKLTEYVVKK